MLPSPYLHDIWLSGFCFWVLLVSSLGFAFSGFWAPRNYWLVMRRPPQLMNLIFVGLFGLLVYGITLNIMQGSACNNLACEERFARDNPYQMLIYWHLVGINALVALFMLWGALVNHARQRDEKDQRAAIDARAAHEQRHAVVIRAAWEETKGSAGFIAALAGHELYCATDDGGMFVVLDKAGMVYPLDFALLNETKAAIHDTLAGNLQGSGIEVLTVELLRLKLLG